MNDFNNPESGFRFDLFDHEISEKLIACRYINLPFNLPDIGPEMNYLLTECGKIFFEHSIRNDMLQSALSNSKIILDFAWEKINTGHWKDVKKTWRDLYSLATIFKILSLLALKNSNKLEIIKECDKGLLLGAPIMGNLLSKIAFKLSEMLLSEKNEIVLYWKDMSKKRKLSSEFKKDLKYEIATKSCFTKDKFVSHHMTKSEPVIIDDAISNWPALSTRCWSVNYILEKCCFRTVPIEIGSKYTDENWTQKLMTIQEFVEQFIWNETKQNDIGYLAQHNLFLQIPELKEDIFTPFYIDENSFVDISFWFGPSGTISPLHYDPKHNLLAQVLGAKYVRLYSKDQTPHLYARDDPLFCNTSQVDVENPDFEKFPLFHEAEFTECILKPGNLLYIPPGCWHYIRSLSTSISISFWW